MRMILKAPRLLPLTMLAIIGVLCIKSVALVQAFIPASSSGVAQAAELAPATPAPEAKAVEPKVAGGHTEPLQKPMANGPPEPLFSESERALLVDLRKRRLELDAKEATIAAREAMLAAAQTRLAARIDELGGLQKRLESLEAARRDRDEASWRGLVKLYETMKPRDAAVIFNDLDPTVLLPVLDRMKEGKAAAIFAAMLPDRARTATTELAQMRGRANAVPPIAAAGTASPAKDGGS